MRAISWRLLPSSCWIALPTNRGSVEILMFAIACTLSGMPPSEYAPVTAIGTAMSETSIWLTVSTTGMRIPRPPNTTRYPTVFPSGVLCLRPEKIRISFGRQIRSSDR